MLSLLFQPKQRPQNTPHLGDDDKQIKYSQGYLPTFYNNWIFKNHKMKQIKYSQIYLHILNMNWIFNKCQKLQTNKHMHFFSIYTEDSLGGYLPIFYINWIFKNLQRLHTHKHNYLPTYNLY